MDARRVLQQLGEENVDGELAAIQDSLADQPGHLQERLLRHPNWRPVFLTCTIAAFSQLTGINALMYYAPKIFSLAGAARDSSLLQSIIIGGTLFVFTIVAMFIIDRFGRRILMLVGSAGMMLCLAMVAAAFSNESSGCEVTVLVALIGFIAFFALSQGAVLFVFISEIFPNTVRSKGQALGTFVHWCMAAAVSWTFPVVAEFCVAGAFWFFAVMMVLQFIFVLRIMPETKGAALEDIETSLTIAARK